MFSLMVMILLSPVCSFTLIEMMKKAKNYYQKNDVRIAWGGREAVETVMSLPRRYGTDDIIFGPKYSFAAVGKNSFDSDKLDDLTYRLALDASIFEQQGCNSPHTVFIEEGSEITPLIFAQNLADAMEKVLKRIPHLL